MKLVIVITFACVAIVAARRVNRGRGTYSYDDDVEVVNTINDYNYGRGLYKYGYELSDGTIREEHSELRNEGRDDEYIVVRGKYSYLAPNDRYYTVNYVADENGYQPEIEEGPGISALEASLIG